MEDESLVMQRFVVPLDCAGLRLDQALARLMPQHSRSRLQSWLREGHVLLDGGPSAEGASHPREAAPRAAAAADQPAQATRAEPARCPAGGLGAALMSVITRPFGR